MRARVLVLFLKNVKKQQLRRHRKCTQPKPDESKKCITPTPQLQDFEQTQPVGKEDKFQSWFVLFGILNGIHVCFFSSFFFLVFFFFAQQNIYMNIFRCFRGASGTCRSSEENMQVMMDGSQRPRNETFAAPKKNRVKIALFS